MNELNDTVFITVIEKDLHNLVKAVVIHNEQERLELNCKEKKYVWTLCKIFRTCYEEKWT